MLRLIAAAVTASLSACKGLRRKEVCAYTPVTRSSIALIEERIVFPSSIADASKGGDETA